MTFFLRLSLVNHRVVDGVVMQSVFTVFCSVARWLSVGGARASFHRPAELGPSGQKRWMRVIRTPMFG